MVRVASARALTEQRPPAGGGRRGVLGGSASAAPKGASQERGSVPGEVRRPSAKRESAKHGVEVRSSGPPPTCFEPGLSPLALATLGPLSALRSALSLLVMENGADACARTGRPPVLVVRLGARGAPSVIVGATSPKPGSRSNGRGHEAARSRGAVVLGAAAPVALASPADD